MEPQQAVLVIGKESSEHVAIRISSRERVGSEDYWDGNWLNAEVSVVVGSWQGQFNAYLGSYDFVRFRKELENLYEKLTGEANFATLDSKLYFAFHGDGLGHIHVDGTACDYSGTGNTLRFSLELDQTYLPNIITQLMKIEGAYPVVGER